MHKYRVEVKRNPNGYTRVEGKKEEKRKTLKPLLLNEYFIPPDP